MARKQSEEMEFESLPDEEDESDGATECKLCEAEAELGKQLCEDCGRCANCGEEWSYRDAKAAHKTEDGRVCDDCYETYYGGEIPEKESKERLEDDEEPEDEE